MSKKRILILSYSFSHQTRNLMKKLVEGLEGSDIDITWERLRSVDNLRFPIGTIPSTVRMMFQTFFRKRFPVKPVNPKVFGQWDLIVLAGPTWSYNPSGVILSLIDRDGKKIFTDQIVLPLISCRGYWRVHFWGLRSLLRKCGAKAVVAPIVFTHPTAEPWNTIGVFLKLAGKMPERGTGWFRKLYPRYGHSREQGETAFELGKKLGQDIVSGKELSALQFPAPVKTPEN